MASNLNDLEASVVYWTEPSELTTYNDITKLVETDEEIKAGGDKFSLSTVELKILHYYTADGAHLLNPFTQSVYSSVNNNILHIGNMSKISIALTNALHKLSVHSGIVYRHDNFSGYEFFLDLHVIGRIVEYSSFLSSSKFVDRYPEGKVQLTIHSKSGREMSWISYSKYYPENEEEVLFAPISKFLVIDRFEKDDRIFITMLEVQ